MDKLIRAARARRRLRDIVIFLVLRFTGMRRESVATLCVRNVAPEWGLRGVVVKGGKTTNVARSCVSNRGPLCGHALRPDGSANSIDVSVSRCSAFAVHDTVSMNG